jgi:hypothetical protein
MKSGNIGHLTRLARGQEAESEAIHRAITNRDAELRLAGMLERNAEVLRRGDRLAVRIRRPDGRVHMT